LNHNMGTFQSPIRQDGNYGANEQCRWTITTTTTNTILLHLNVIEVEEKDNDIDGSNRCVNDFIKVYTPKRYIRC